MSLVLHPAETVRDRQCAEAYHPILHDPYERQYPYRTSHRFRFRCRGKPSFGGWRSHNPADTRRRLRRDRMATALKKPSREKEETREGDMSLCAHPVVHHDLSQTESQSERIASKMPVFQIVIVTFQPQRASALCLCRFQQLQAPHSFLLRYLSNAYDRVTASSSGGYLLIIFSGTY